MTSWETSHCNQVTDWRRATRFHSACPGLGISERADRFRSRLEIALYAWPFRRRCPLCSICRLLWSSICNRGEFRARDTTVWRLHAWMCAQARQTLWPGRNRPILLDRPCSAGDSAVLSLYAKYGECDNKRFLFIKSLMILKSIDESVLSKWYSNGHKNMLEKANIFPYLVTILKSKSYYSLFNTV